jgi:hypothetical protein
MAFFLAAVPYVVVGAIFRGPVYDRFDSVTTFYKLTFWAFYVAQICASLLLCTVVARMFRLPLIPAALGAVVFLALIAWPTLYFHSMASSCELDMSYPVPDVHACS